MEKIRAVLGTNVLVGKNRRPLLAAKFISELEAVAIIVDDKDVSGGNYDEWLSDHDDHPVMATALVGEAEFLVTEDKDFPPKKKFAGTSVITVEAFASRMKIGLEK